MDKVIAMILTVSLAFVTALPIVGCSKKVDQGPTLEQPLAEVSRSETASSEDSSVATAIDPTIQPPIDPHEIAEHLQRTVMPTDDAEFGFPSGLSCSDPGPNDPWSVRCGLTAPDKARQAPAQLAIEIYDHDLVFEERAELLKTMTLKLGTEGLIQYFPSSSYEHDSQRVTLPYACDQPRPSGPGFCVILPSPRILFVSAAARGHGDLLNDDAMQRASDLSTIVMRELPRWGTVP